MKAAILCLLLIAAYVAYEAIHLWIHFKASQSLIATATPFERVEGNKRLLVLGDSIAFGVGADTSSHSVAGRVAAEMPDYAVENRSVIGARVTDLATQLNQARSPKYDLALIAIGANDIIRFKSAAMAQEELRQFLKVLRNRVDKIVFLTAGNVGSATIVPLVLRPLYHRRTLDYHRAFEELAKQTQSTYVNLYQRPDSDPFVIEPTRYLAADGLHPSSEGYRLFFEQVKSAL